MLSIIIDNREPKYIQELKFSNAVTIVSLLEAGDLMIATENNEVLLIERKSPEDLLGSIKDGRLFEQCHKMKAQTTWAYVVITGQFSIGQNGKVWCNQRETGWNFDAIEGALLTIQELGCFVVHCKNEMDFGATVERLIKRERGLLSIGCARSSNILSAGEVLLTSLPGIGLDKAQRILSSQYNTPAKALEFLTEFGRNGVQGIGDGTKANIKKALGLSQNESLIVVNKLDREFIGLNAEQKESEITT